MADFTIKKGSTRPTLVITLTYSDGTTVDLTGGTAKFVMRSMTSTTAYINAAVAITSVTAPCTVQYTFTATDTLYAGSYQGEIVATFADSSILTFPTDGYIDLVVEEDTVTATPISRLVQLTEVKDHLNIVATDRTHDTELIRFLDGCTPIIEFLTGPIIQRPYDEWYDGGAWFVSVRHRPIVSVESVDEYRGPIRYPLTQIASPDLGTIYSYMFDVTGRVTRRTVGGGQTTFPPGADTVHIKYTAGQTVVPANVKLATLELVRVNYQQTQQGGRPQYGSGAGLADDYSGGQMMGFFVPNRVREMLSPNRRKPSIA